MKRLIFIALIFFIGCSTNPPKWYNKIYNDNSYYIYATGDGANKKEAINSALANASSKIAIVVKSMFKSLKYQYKGNDTNSYSSNSILDIETKTNPITFTDYKIVKLEKKDKYYVLIKINRYKNAKYMCENTSIPKIDINNLNVLLNYKTILKTLNQKIKKLKNINALYPLCKNKLNKILSLKKEIINKYNNLTYTITSNDKKLKDIIEAVLNINESKKGDIHLLVKTNTTYKKIGEYKIATIYVNLKLKCKNLSKNFSFICASSSIQDYSTAKELAYNKCKEKIKKIFNN